MDNNETPKLPLPHGGGGVVITVLWVIGTVLYSLEQHAGILFFIRGF